MKTRQKIIGLLIAIVSISVIGVYRANMEEEKEHILREKAKEKMRQLVIQKENQRNNNTSNTTADQKNIPDIQEPVAGKQYEEWTNKSCPIMPEKPIRKEYYTIYKGKKLYLCCLTCLSRFELEHEKYHNILVELCEQETSK